MEINSLREAASFFHNSVVEDKVLKQAGLIKPRYENLSRKYYNRDHSAGDDSNEYNMYIQKQLPKGDSRPNIAIVLKEDTVSPLGSPDYHYYVVIYRKKWLNRWSDTLDKPKYSNQLGIYLPIRILDYLEDNGIIQQSELVLVLPDCSIHKAPCNLVHDFIYKKLNRAAFVNAYSQVCSAVAKEIFDQ